jgi:hypothetical protein
MSLLSHLARDRLPIAVVVVSGVLMIAGCGSSKASSTVPKGPNKPSALSFMQANLEWAVCIRTHGVPNFPDPTFGAGGAQVNLSTPAGMLTSPALLSGAVLSVDFRRPLHQRRKRSCTNGADVKQKSARRRWVGDKPGVCGIQPTSGAGVRLDVAGFRGPSHFLGGVRV